MKYYFRLSGNVKGSRIYSRCIASLKKYPLPLQSPLECEILEGFGDKICQQLMKKLTDHAKELNTTPELVVQGSDKILLFH